MSASETASEITSTFATPARRSRRRAPAVATAALGAVLAASLPGIASAAPAATHTFGALAPTARVTALAGLSSLSQSAAAAGGSISVESALPTTVDLTSYAVPPADQGQHGACVSFTTAYTLAGWTANFTHHDGVPFEPMYVYNQVNGGSDTRGTTFTANFGVLESQGDLEAAYWDRAFSDYRSQPTTAQKADAALHKLSAHTTLFAGANQGLAAQTAIETALANNQPVGLSFPVYSAFNSLNSTNSTFALADATGSVLGNHAVAVLGYDANGVTIENSWGTNWGDHGFATIAWDFIEAKALEAVAAGTFATGQNNLAPAVTRLSKATVPTGGGAALTVTAARLPSVDTTAPTAVQFVSVTDASVTASATVTGSTPSTLTVTTPVLPADGNYRVVVTGAGGASVPNGTTDVVTALQPYAVAVATGSVARSDTATKVTIVGSGFGTTLTAFRANKVTATVGGKVATVAWVDDSHLTVIVPAAPVGTTPLVVSRNGVASPSVDVTILPPLAVVGGLSPARVDVAGGATVTASVRNASTATGLTLVSVTDPTVTVAATITARTASSLTFVAPAAPNGDQGGFHLVVTGTGGTSVASTVDVLGYRTPMTATRTATVASALGGTTVTLTGSGFGTTSVAFAANRLTASVNGTSAVLRWVGDTTLVATLPKGVPGVGASLVLTHDGVVGAPIPGITYEAVIGGSSAAVGPTAGWTAKITGIGFTDSTGWTLVDGSGTTAATLTVVTTPAALAASTTGAVLITAPNAATVQLPAEAAGMYRLQFTPDTTHFPGSSDSAFSSKAVVVYSDLG